MAIESHGRGRAKTAVVLGVALVLKAGVLSPARADSPVQGPVPNPVVAPALASSPEETYGVKAASLRFTMDGRMLDFRYEVVDASRARPLFDHKIKPYLLDPARGTALGVPEDSKLGALRASVRNPPVAGKQYYVLFANPVGGVAKGSKVTVVIGDCRFDDVLVE